MLIVFGTFAGGCVGLFLTVTVGSYFAPHASIPFIFLAEITGMLLGAFSGAVAGKAVS